MKKAKKSIFDSPLLSSKIKSAKPKLFPEGALGYLGGPTLALVANSILSNYFNKYLTDLYGITTWASLFNTLLPLISVIFVVLGNLLVGRLMDKSKTRAGKARPLLLLSLPLSLIGILVLFVLNPGATAQSTQTAQITSLILVAVGYNLWFAIAYPLYFTPHSALVNLSTRSGKDRSLLATLSNASNIGALGISTMILPFFLGFLFKYDMNPSDPTAQAVFKAGTTEIDYYTDASGRILYDVASSFNAWKVFMIAVLVIVAIGVFIEYYFTRERVSEEALAMATEKVEGQDQKAAKPITIGEQWKICRKDKYWIIVIVLFVLFQFGGMIKNVSQLYYCTAWFPDANGNYTTVSGGNFSGTLGILGAIPTALGMVIAWPLSNKIGKGKAILFGALVAVFGGALGFLVPVVPVEGRFAVTAASFIIKSLGSTPAMYLSIALLGDVMDHQEALYGKRTDGLSMTIYGAIMAGMIGLVTGLLNGVLSATGYDPNAPQTVQTSMLFLFIGGETLCYLVIAALFVFMKVERFSKFDHAAIVEDQKAKCERLGIAYVSPEERMAAVEKEVDEAAEVARINDLKALCEKKGLSFEAEEAKYQQQLAEKNAAAEAKAAEKKAKAEAKAAAKAAKPVDEAKLAAKKAKLEAEEKLTEAEFLRLREATKAVREQALFGE